MSNAPFDLQQELDECEFEHILSQLEQQWPLRDQVAKALKEASAALAAQCTQPDGDTYMQTCDDLVKFLDLKVSLEYTEQKLLVQVLQIACAMHENAVNNPTLTPTQHSCHYLATTSLVSLCRSAVEGSITHPDLWREACKLIERAEQALVRATDALDLSRYLGWGSIPDHGFSGSGNEADQTLAVPPPTPTVSEFSIPREPVHDTVSDERLDIGSTRLKHKALAMLKDQPYRAAPLGRHHTMPALTHTAFSPYPSRTTAGRTSSRAHSRGHGLHALEETEN